MLCIQNRLMVCLREDVERLCYTSGQIKVCLHLICLSVCMPHLKISDRFHDRRFFFSFTSPGCFMPSVYIIHWNLVFPHLQHFRRFKTNLLSRWGLSCYSLILYQPCCWLHSIKTVLLFIWLLYKQYVLPYVTLTLQYRYVCLSVLWNIFLSILSWSF